MNSVNKKEQLKIIKELIASLDAGKLKEAISRIIDLKLSDEEVMKMLPQKIGYKILTTYDSEVWSVLVHAADDLPVIAETIRPAITQVYKLYHNRSNKFHLPFFGWYDCFDNEKDYESKTRPMISELSNLPIVLSEPLGPVAISCFDGIMNVEIKLYAEALKSDAYNRLIKNALKIVPSYMTIIWSYDKEGTIIPDYIAEQISESNSQRLYMDRGIIGMSDYAAGVIAEYKGAITSLDGLREFPDSPGFIKLANKLVATNNSLQQTIAIRVNRLPDKVAKVLSGCQFDLSVGAGIVVGNGIIYDEESLLEEVTIKSAQSLSEKKTGALIINAKYIGQDAVVALLKSSCDLSLHAVNMKSISEDVARAIAKRKNATKIYVAEINAKAAEILSNYKGIELEIWDLKYLDIESAEKLSNIKAKLSLWGLDDRSDDAVKLLKSRLGDLVFIYKDFR